MLFTLPYHAKISSPPFQDLQMSHPKLWHQVEIQDLKSSVSGSDAAEALWVQFLSFFIQRPVS